MYNRVTLMWLAMAALLMQSCAVVYPVYIPVDVVSIGAPAGNAAGEPFPTTTTFLGIHPREVTEGQPPELRLGLEISNRSGKDATVALDRVSLEEVAIGRHYALTRANVRGQQVGKAHLLKAGDSQTVVLTFAFPQGFRFDAMGAFRLRWAMRTGEHLRPFVARFERYRSPEPRYYAPYPWWYYAPVAFGFGFTYHHHRH